MTDDNDGDQGLHEVEDMVVQIESLERREEKQWIETKSTIRASKEKEEEDRSLKAEIPKLQRELLKVRQSGDALEMKRLEVEDETRRLHEDHSHLQSVQRFMSTTTLTAREDARAGLHDNEKQLKLLESHRLELEARTETGPQAEVATAKAADETCQAEVVGAEQNLASESKKEADISLACETIDQALENVLKETKGEYKLFNKVNVNCAALSKGLEVGEQREEGLARQLRPEENASTALRKQCTALGLQIEQILCG